MLFVNLENSRLNSCCCNNNSNLKRIHNGLKSGIIFAIFLHQLLLLRSASENVSSDIEYKNLNFELSEKVLFWGKFDFFLAHFWYQSKQCTAMATPQATSSLLIILPCHDLQFLMIALIAIAMGGHLCCIYSANEIGKNWHNNLNRTQYNILLPLQFWGIKSRCFSQS